MRFGKRQRDEPSVRVRQLEAVTPQATPWRAPWPILTIMAAVVTAAASWLLVAGFCVLGWITVPQIKAVAVLKLGTQGWLLSHGVSVALPGAQLSIMPLGITAIIAAIGLGTCQYAVTHSRPPEPDRVGVRVLRMGLVFGATYLVIIAVARGWSEGQLAGQSSLIGTLVLVFGLGLVAFARALRWRPSWLPDWAPTIGRTLTAGLAVLVLSGAAVFVTALIQGRDRIAMIHDSLDPGVLGGVMLLLGQLAWLPNFVLWSAAWALGAGVQLGVDTVISPGQSLVGLLPAIPVLGAVPPAGPMPRLALLWLVFGVLAGVAVAWVLVGQLLREASRRGREIGIDLAAIVGALAGVVCALVFVAAQLPASGDLGSVRLLGLGARMGVLLVMAPSTMGLAGMATGAWLGWRTSRAAGPTSPPAAAPDEPTVHVHAVEDDQPTTVVADRRPGAEADE